MKRLVSFLLTLCLVVGFVPLAYAEDSGSDAAGGAVEADGEESPAPEISLIPEENKVVVQDYEELLKEIETAEDGATIYLQYSIRINGTEGYVIGAEDKTITLSLCDDYSGGYLFYILDDTKVTFENVVIQGSEDITLSQNIINISGQNSEVILSNVTIRNFVCERAAILNYGKMDIKDCRFENIQSNVNSVLYTTEGIIYSEGTAIIDRSSFLECSCPNQGSIIHNMDTIKISNSQFYDNKTQSDGTIFSGQYTECEIENTSIINNSANITQSAGIYTTYGCELSLVDCEIYGNTTSMWKTSDLYCKYGKISITYTKPLEEIYTLEDRIPYGWVSIQDAGVDLSGAEKVDLPYQPDNSVGVQMCFVFVGDLPESEDSNSTNPPFESEDNGQKQPPIEEGDIQESQPPTEDDEQDQQSAEGDNGQEPPKEQGNEDTGTDVESPTNPSDSGQDFPTHRPSEPSAPPTSPAPEDESKDENTEIPVDNVPVEDAPRLVCNGAVIDASKTIVLLGYGDGKLHETDSLTRAQLATIVYRLLDDESIDLYSNSPFLFVDVAANAWYAPYVRVIQAAGIVNGIGDDKYDPDGTATWAQIITILTRFVEAQEIELQHIQYDGWATSALKTAVALGWIEDSAAFNPDAIISRGELVQLINDVLKKY